MPITVTVKYHTSDGAGFDTLEAAKAHEDKLSVLQPLIKVLQDAWKDERVMTELTFDPMFCQHVAECIQQKFNITLKEPS